MGVWQFIQDQVFGMKWLNELIGKGLSKLGLDVGERIGGSIQFFFYDVLKITVLLCLLIFVLSAGTKQADIEPVPWCRCKYHICPAGNCDAFLFLLVHSTFYRLHQRRVAAGSYILFSDFIPYGGLGESYSFNEHFRGKSCGHLCDCRFNDRCGRRHLN